MEMEIDKYVEAQNRKDRFTLMGCVGSLAALAAIVLLLVLCYGCTTPKVAEEQHHHYAQADTMAVQSLVDHRMQAIKELMLQELTAKVQQQQTEQQTDEQQKERVTETITMWVDSMGRQMRQEQRTTERDISRQQQLREQRMAQEWENRLMTVVDSMNHEWSEKMKLMQGHREQNDSTLVHQEPVPGDNRPWYKQMGDALMWMLVGGVVAAVIWFTRKLWMQWLRLLFG